MPRELVLLYGYPVGVQSLEPVLQVPRSSPKVVPCFPNLIQPTSPDKKREYFGVKKEWVDGFELIPIIDVGAPGQTQQRLIVWTSRE